MIRFVPLAAALFLAALAAPSTSGQDPKVQPVKPVLKADDTKVVPEPFDISLMKDKNKHRAACEKIRKLEVANSLINLSGDSETSTSNKVAALLLAAETLHHLHPTPGAMKDEQGKALADDAVTPAALIKKAKELAKDDAQLLALVALTEKELAGAHRGSIPYPISGNTTLNGAAIYERQFAVGAPAIVYASTPGGEVISVKIMNTSSVPPTVVEERTGSTVRLEWCPRPGGPNPNANTYKIFITPVSPPGFRVSWGTN